DRRPRRRARQKPAGEGPARFRRAGRAVQEQRRSGARLLRDPVENRRGSPRSGRIRGLAAGGSGEEIKRGQSNFPVTLLVARTRVILVPGKLPCPLFTEP